MVNTTAMLTSSASEAVDCCQSGLQTFRRVADNMPRLAALVPLLIVVAAVPLALFRRVTPTPAPFVELRPGLWRSRSDFNFFPPPALPTPVAAWLVEGKSSWVLIDAGVNTEAYAPGFKAALQEHIAVSSKKLGAVLRKHYVASSHLCRLVYGAACVHAPK